jgi:HK97 family phage prohead protease
MSRPSPEPNYPADPNVLERRAAGLEIRADGNRIVGHAILFGSRSRDLGGFCEVVSPQAVDRSLVGDVVALYNHDPHAVLGRTPKTLTLHKDDRGLAFELEPAPTQAGRDALELVRRGDVRGASFGFHKITDAWARDGAVTVRTLLDIELVEISLTALPLYAGTNVELARRSLQAFQSAVPRRSVRWLRLQGRTR